MSDFSKIFDGGRITKEITQSATKPEDKRHTELVLINIVSKLIERITFDIDKYQESIYLLRKKFCGYRLLVDVPILKVNMRSSVLRKDYFDGIILRLNAYIHAVQKDEQILELKEHTKKPNFLGSKLLGYSVSYFSMGEGLGFSGLVGLEIGYTALLNAFQTIFSNKDYPSWALHFLSMTVTILEGARFNTLLSSFTPVINNYRGVTDTVTITAMNWKIWSFAYMTRVANAQESGVPILFPDSRRKKDLSDTTKARLNFTAEELQPTENDIHRKSYCVDDLGFRNQGECFRYFHNQIKIGINGTGEIGTLIAHFAMKTNCIEVVAINKLPTSDSIEAWVTRLNSMADDEHKLEVHDESTLVFGNNKSKKIKVYGRSEPKEIPWYEAGAEIVLECTGCYSDMNQADAHLDTLV